jgi:hypothetical protein
MSGKRMILALPRASASEELQEPENPCRELEIKNKGQPGQSVFEREPEKYRRVVEMIEQQRPVRDIAKECQVSFSTITSIRRHAGLSAENEREALTETIRCAARVVAERVLELGELMSPKEASISLGILTDKLLILSGEPNFISVNRSEQIMTHDEYNRILCSLPSAQVIEISNSQEADEAPKGQP